MPDDDLPESTLSLNQRLQNLGFQHKGQKLHKLRAFSKHLLELLNEFDPQAQGLTDDHAFRFANLIFSEMALAQMILSELLEDERLRRANILAKDRGVTSPYQEKKAQGIYDAHLEKYRTISDDN